MASKGANINQNDNNGWTALMRGIYYVDDKFKFISFNGIIPPYSAIAAQNGNKDVIEFLTSKGADINHKNNNSWTSLMIGIKY